MKSEKQIRMAYLVGQYPAINHTFVLREVRQLRGLNFDLHVASILKSDRPPQKLTPEEQEELRLTTYVKPSNPLAALAPHLRTLFTRPAGYLKGLSYTLGICLSAPKSSPSSLLYFVEAVILGRWMEQQKITHVHSHFTSSVCLIARRIFPITMSVTIHGPEEFNDPAAFRLAEKVRAASFICAISNFARSQLMRYSENGEWDKIEVSPLGVDPGVFAPRPFRESPSPFEIICVGRLAPVKAQHILVEAIDVLVKQGRDVRLRIVGDGSDRAQLERSVETRALGGHVRFEGWLNQDRVLELYREADIFALASFAEGVPVVLMEAMAMEIPCVATHVNGIPELIRDGIDGLLVSPSDAGELAHGLARLMDDGALRRGLGEAGRKRVCEKYDLARNTARLAEIFRRRLGAGAHEEEEAETPLAQGERVQAVSEAVEETVSARF
jgi:colanic acid/amylovoran biosynthesis glycosyltransferase